MSRLQLHILCGILVLGSAIASCKKKDDPPLPASYENGTFLLNEGNFQGGNASLDFWHAEGDSLSRGIFRQHHDFPLGDVAQSMVLRYNKAWIVVNNSGKIEVVDLPSLDLHCTVQGMTSPRYLLFLSASKAYVSDLYSKTIHILNPETCSITGNIPTGGWTEELVMAEGQVFVAQTGTDKVLVIDPATDQITDSLTVGREPNSLQADASGLLWVLCSGGLGETNGTLASIDPISHQVNVVHTFADVNDSPDRLRIDPAGERIYWVQAGTIMYWDIGQSQAPQVFAAGRGGRFYGLDIDPVSGQVYVGDALDFVREGWLYRYSPTGSLQDSFRVGAIPGSFAFD